MKNFKLNMLTVALIAAGASTAAVAQQTTDASEQAKEDGIEVIAVTGYRGSLQKAQAIKMSESSVVEVLSAEDIGKLPDTSIAAWPASVVTAAPAVCRYVALMKTT